MLRSLAPGLAGLTLAACASSGADRLPVCDGHHRRPANPNGSVLSPPMAATAAPSPAKRPPHAGDRASFAPCGDDQ